jgi:hypothetical protein
MPLSAILMIAAVGAITGLYFFFHGFSLLQQRALLSKRGYAQKPPQNSVICSTTTFTPHDSNTLKLDSQHEVIHLSPNDTPQADSASMTQQGKIAAALLKAGIRNPVTVADNRVQTEVRLREQISHEQSTKPQVSGADVFRALQKTATAAEIPLPSLEAKAVRTPSAWEANVMIWGGPALTLVCIYVLASRLGWL